MRTRAITAIAAAAALALPLTACGTSSTGTRSDTKPSHSKAAKGVDCESDQLSQADWVKHCADDTGSDKAPQTDLKVGQTFTYKDGVAVTVDSVKTITKFGEFDDHPKSATPFRVNITFNNGSKKPLNLDDFGVNVVGATNGGDALGTSYQLGSKEITGRVAPGVKDTKNSDWDLDKKYGSQVVVTVTRMSAGASFFDKDPEWTGPIR